MPKSKPHQTIQFRIEFQDKERELIEQYMKPKIFQNYANAASAATVCAGVGMAGYAAYWFLRGLGNTAQDIAAWWDGIGSGLDKPLSVDSFKDDPDKKGYSKDGTPQNIFGLPGWGIIPGWI